MQQLPFLISLIFHCHFVFNDEFIVAGEARAMWYEKAYLWVKFVERNVLYPLLFLAAINDSVEDIKTKFGVT